MNSDRPKHTEPTSTDQHGGEEPKGPCSSESLTGYSDLARIEKPALNPVPMNLMEQVVDPDNIECAWARVKSNRGAPGPDGITLDEFPDHFRDLWPELQRQLLEGTYKPGPVRRKSIPKPDGGERHLGIPNVIDRLVQQAILLVLTPIFDPEFSDSSFGFRPYRSAHEAIHLVQTHIRSGKRWCVDMDLSKFFDRVQHDVLMARVARKVRDKRMLRLIGNYLRAGVMIDGLRHRSTEGTMQGGPLSPLLANILLDDFDKEMENRGHPFVRYADDFLVFSKTEQSATRVFKSIERYLTGKLKLVVNHDKSSVCPTEVVEFLGYTFRGYGGRFGVSPKKIRRFRDRVKQITRRVAGRSIDSRLHELRPYFNGWVGYFHYGLSKRQSKDFDKWTRRRVRACYWHQWYRVRTWIRMLLKLGVRRDEAFSHGSSGRGPWVMSSSAAAHVALSKTYLQQQGLASLEEMWSKFASRNRTA